MLTMTWQILKFAHLPWAQSSTCLLSFNYFLFKQKKFFCYTLRAVCWKICFLVGVTFKILVFKHFQFYKNTSNWGMVTRSHPTLNIFHFYLAYSQFIFVLILLLLIHNAWCKLFIYDYFLRILTWANQYFWYH